MSDEGEKTCPLCAEEMDLTDQQLRPCKCGYEICVWCWHHIMDMAEKDNTEGRCPACRTPYNKEKIVGTASKCERLVTGMSVEKKQKSQKGKIKTPEGRKQLGSVRVIQRNLVYIVGLPLNLADEDLLQQKDYFGQYGKVLKVSISRTAAGSIQQFANSTCSVYITYSKEEEAVRSIQSAHGFILEGRPLRACFGTTKYCHAWLRNMPCTNADCLYLHEFGPQEDSFTKDEIITAYTRNRVQQITGVTNEMQRRSGNLLPPPTDDYSNSAWPKPISKTTTNNPTNGMKIPLPNSNSGKSIALPPAASWGTRASNSQLSFKAESMKEVVGGTNKNIPDKFPSSSETFSNPVLDEDKEGISHLSCDMSSISINNIQKLEPSEAEQFPETFDSNEAENIAKQSDLVSDFQKKVAISEAEENLVSFIDQRLGGDNTEVIQSLSHMGFYPQHASVSANGGLDPPTSQNGYPSSSLVGTSNGHYDTEGQKGQTALDLGENSIISNILSMDFDPWDDSLTSPQNLAKFLGESESLKVLSSRKTQKNSNQSRFSFAREDEEPNLSDFGQGFEYNNISSNNSIYLDNKINNSIGNGFSSFSFGESEHFATNYFPISENKVPVSRAQVSAPPGFSGPSRAPPPGFTSQMEQTFDNLSGNYISSVRKVHEAVNNGGGVSDLEFMDPAILAVGGRVPSGIETRSNFPAQLNSYESDVRLQVLMQRSFSQQNPRFVDNYSQQTDSYGIPSRMVEQSYQHTGFQQQARSSLMSNNGHWNSWNEVQNSNDIGMGELLRNERLGFNRYYSGHEDSKFQLSTSRDLYNNTTFGI